MRDVVQRPLHAACPHFVQAFPHDRIVEFEGAVGTEQQLLVLLHLRADRHRVDQIHIVAYVHIVGGRAFQRETGQDFPCVEDDVQVGAVLFEPIDQMRGEAFGGQQSLYDAGQWVDWEYLCAFCVNIALQFAFEAEQPHRGDQRLGALQNRHMLHR